MAPRKNARPHSHGSLDRHWPRLAATKTCSSRCPDGSSVVHRDDGILLGAEKKRAPARRKAAEGTHGHR